MKKWTKFMALAAVFIFAAAMITGCGSGSGATGSSGDSGGSDANPGSGSIDESSAQKIGSASAIAASNCAGMAQLGSSVVVSGVTSRPEEGGGPPDSFLTTDILTDATDGYVSVNEVFTAEGQDAKVRLITKGGEYVDSDFITDMKLGVLGGYDWDTFFRGQSPSASQKQAFADNPSYAQYNDLGGYLIWSYIGPMWIDQYMPEGAPSISAPEPETADELGGMQCIITQTGDGFSGTTTFQVTVDEDGKPSSAEGTGTMTQDNVTITISAEMAFDENGNPQSVTTSGSTSDGYSFTMTVQSDGTGTGTISNSDGEQVATITLNADGTGTVTDNEGNEYNFTL